MAYIIDQIEHGNGGVCGTTVLEKLPLKEALKRTPYDYDGVMPKMFGFYPVICGNDKNHNSPLYTWSDSDGTWRKNSASSRNKHKKPKLTNIQAIELKEIDLGKLDGCKHPDISVKKEYLVVYNGHKIIGKFGKEWYGWSFDWFGSHYAGLQIDSFEKVYEISYR